MGLSFLGCCKQFINLFQKVKRSLAGAVDVRACFFERREQFRVDALIFLHLAEQLHVRSAGANYFRPFPLTSASHRGYPFPSVAAMAACKSSRNSLKSVLLPVLGCEQSTENAHLHAASRTSRWARKWLRSA